MEDKARPDDYRLLGLAPEAGEADLDRAYHRARAIYSEGSLATYSMMDEDERAAMRARIEGAHMRIGATISRLRQASFTAATDPGDDPGATLPVPAAHPSPAMDAAPSFSPTGGAGVPASPLPDAAPPPLDWESPPGPQLRRLRESLGLTLQQIAAVTRVRSTHFINIEEGNVAELPSTVYLRGFLIDYARRLRLPDPEGVAVRYLGWVAGQAPRKE